MERKLTKLEHSHVEVLVKVDETTWKDAQKKAFNKLAKDVTVPGFRKGNAPENMVKSKIDQVKVMDEAINGLLPVMYKDILDNEDVKPFAQPKIDVTALSDTSLEVKFTIITAPEVKLGQYKDHNIGKVEAKVSEKEIKEAIDKDVANNATLVVKEGTAKKGDTVVMDFVGTIKGEKFDGGSAQNHELELGSNSFIPGFEDQLIGVKAGEKKVVKVTFPENYLDELKGKEAEFECDVHEVKEKKIPELNDELVKEMKIPGVDNVESYKKYKKNQLLLNKKNQLHSEYMGKLLEAIKKSSKFDIPSEVVEQQIAARKEDIVNRMKQSGLTLEQYLQFTNTKEEDFLANLKKESENDVENFLVYEEVAKAEKIVIGEAELEFEYAKLADQYKMKIEDVRKALEPNKDSFIHQTKMARVEDFLNNHNN